MGRRTRRVPQTAGFADVLGQRAVLDVLRSAIARDTLHHAYLFEGPRGCGKSLVALRLAMAAACEEGEPAKRPCSTCSTCKQIEAGTHPDVVFIGPDPDRAAPIITVKQIRQLTRELGYHRYNARRRTVVIEPAEALQDPAANALLKTLEEPPEGTGFVLICAHRATLLPTLPSRCQRLRFGPVPDEELLPWLKERGVAEPALAARMAGGCPGIALSLDKAVNKRTKLRGQVVAAVEGPLDALFKFSQTLVRGNRASWRPKVDMLLDLIEDLLRDVVIAGAQSDLAPIDREAADVVERWRARLYPDGVTRCAQAIDQARARLGVYANGRTVVDAVLTRLWTELAVAPGARPVKGLGVRR